MLAQQRLYAKVVFEAQFAALHTNAFQSLFPEINAISLSHLLAGRALWVIG